MDMQELSVAILTHNQHHAARDKQSCLKLNVKHVMVFDALDEVLDQLREQTFHLLLIDASVKDMDGRTCLKTIRRHNQALALPAVMVTSESSLQHVLDAIAAGCNGYVIRPYSMNTFERHLQLAFETMGGDEIETEQLHVANDLVQQGRFDEAIEEYTEIVEEESEAITFFNRGMEYLHRQKYGKAILAFNKAVALNSMYAEAYKGLALAHKGKGDEEKYRAYLEKSAEVLAMQDRLDELKELFVDILKANPEAINPYNTMGIDLRRRGDYLGAMHAYSQALKLTPQDENLHYNIAKACVFAKDYHKAMEHLEQAVAIRQDFEEAKRMLAKLRARQYDQISTPTAGQSSPGSGGSLAMDL